jgi:hypothetical protein
MEYPTTGRCRTRPGAPEPLGLEIHDDVFREGVLSADFEHSEKLAEMALGELGIDGQPELSACLCGRNNFALRSGCGFLH